MAEVLLADRLSTASANGNLPEVLLLLQHGVSVNAFNAFNRTALQVAKLGNTALVEALLLAGADPNLPDPVLQLTVTHDAARDGYVDTVRVLVDHGANPNLVDDRGNLPLHLAAKEGHLRVVQLLIERTADPQASNVEGASAAKLALQAGEAEIYNFIQEYLGTH